MMENNFFNSELSATLKKLGISVNDTNLYLTAFTHTSYTNEIGRAHV